MINKPMYVKGNLVEKLEKRNKMKKRKDFLRKTGLGLAGLAAIVGVSVGGSHAVIRHQEGKYLDYLNNLQTQEITLERGEPFTYDGIARKISPEEVDYRKIRYDIQNLNPDKPSGKLRYGDRIIIPFPENYK